MQLIGLAVACGTNIKFSHTIVTRVTAKPVEYKIVITYMFASLAAINSALPWYYWDLFPLILDHSFDFSRVLLQHLLHLACIKSQIDITGNIRKPTSQTCLKGSIQFEFPNEIDHILCQISARSLRTRGHACMVMRPYCTIPRLHFVTLKGLEWIILCGIA